MNTSLKTDAKQLYRIGYRYVVTVTEAGKKLMNAWLLRKTLLLYLLKKLGNNAK